MDQDAIDSRYKISIDKFNRIQVIQSMFSHHKGTGINNRKSSGKIPKSGKEITIF